MSRTDSQAGFTLVEALCALSLLGIAMAAVLPSFLQYADSNDLSEERSYALTAAQQAMETLRSQQPASLPTGGSPTIDFVTVGDREFEIVTTFCSDNTFCAADRRHVRVEVNFGGTPLYSVTSILGSW